MDTNRPITDYEVECIYDKSTWLTKGVKYPIVRDVEACWVVIDNTGEEGLFIKDKFLMPTLKPNLPPPPIPNPDIDLLDKFVIGMVTGIYADPTAGNINEHYANQLYEVAQIIVNARKKYLTLNTPDNG